LVLALFSASSAVAFNPLAPAAAIVLNLALYSAAT
jgi:hypothetical protein